MSEYLTFKEIYETVMTAIGDVSFTRTAEVKSVINMVYLTEIAKCDELYPLFWLVDCDDSKKSKVKATITGITAATPPIVSATAHGFVTGDVVTIYGVVGMTELNFRTFRVTYLTANTFSLQDLSGADIVGAAYTAWTSGGTAQHRGVSLTNCQRVLHANWHGYDKGMDFIGPEQVEAQASWMDVSTSRPTKMMHRKSFSAVGVQYDHLLWFQAADAAYNARIWTEKQPARLSADTDIPQLPFQFQDSLAAGAITRLGESKVQVEAGVIWPSVYKAHIDAIKVFNRQWWQTQKTNERNGLYLA